MKSSLTRISWLDSVRGITIILVVAFHSMRSIGNDATPEVIVDINYLLGAARMPTFFMVSGVLTSFGINRAFLDYTNRRVMPIVWLFVLWNIILILISRYATWPSPLGISYLATMWTDPYVHMWFMRDLILMALAARLLVDVPSYVCIPLAVLYYIASTYKFFSFDLPANLLIFYLIGLRFSGVIFSVTESRKYVIVIFSFISYVSIALIFGIEEAKPIVAAFGTLFIVSFAAILDGISAIGKALSFLGSVSLPIYLLHLIAIENTVILQSSIFGSSQMVLYLAIVATGIIVPVLLWMLALKLNLKLLFTSPKCFKLPNSIVPLLSRL